MRILHIVKGGSVYDGIQSQLLAHTFHPKMRDIDWKVMTLLKSERLFEALKSDEQVGRFRSEGIFPFSFRAVRDIWRFQPDIIHCWGHAANLVSLTFRPLFSSAVLWHLCDSGPAETSVKIVDRLNSVISRVVPHRILCCCNATYEVYSEYYPKERLKTVTGGVDTSIYSPQLEGAAILRSKLGIPQEAVVIGMAARYSPEKGFVRCLEAVAELRKQLPGVFLIFSGDGCTEDNPQLRENLDRLNMRDCTRLLGFRADMPVIHSSANVTVCASSAVEAIGCSILEAMACESIPVVTPIGELERIVDGCGFVAKDLSPDSLAEQLHIIATHSAVKRSEMKRKARKRIQEEFSIDLAVDGLLEVYASLVC